ncbi:MAG: DUF4962 domain-containing protein [Chloroflexi bacterium]|nr:MAG: DUF4962 domain-containing protein [Chloroflexota bacterium]
MTNYLFLQAHSIAEWRKLGQTTHARQMSRLLQQADTYKHYLPPAEHPRDSITYIGMAVANLSLAWLLTEQTDYLAATRRWLKVGLNYPHWGLARMPDHDLDAAWLLFGFGLAYNWIGSHLPADELDALQNKLLRQGRLLYNFALETEGRWWGSAYWQNHNWICYGGLATAAYALQTDHPETRAWSARALENLQAVLAAFPEDGSDYEGPVYWRYGFPWLLIGAHLFQEQAGIDLHQSEFLRHAFEFRLYFSGPNLVDTLNFGDGHDRRSAHSRAVYYRLAGLYQNGHAQWLAEHFEQTGEWEREGREGLVKPGLLPEAWLDFVWYDPAVSPIPLDSLPLTKVFPDMGVVSTRTGWQADATVLAFKCGTPNGRKGWHLGHTLNRKNGWDIIKASHEHPDENSFILIRGNDYLTVDEGYSKAKLTQNHSTVLVDGRGQYADGGYNAFAGLGPEWGGRLESWFALPELTYACGEAAPAYAPELQLGRFQRQIVRVGAQLVIICDDLQSSRPHTYDWLLQTDAPPRPVGSRAFAVTAGRSAMQVLVLAPAEFTHTVQAQEITANPTSAKPDWIIRRTQHTLALRPAEACAQTRFLVALDLADPGCNPAEVVSLACEGGTAVKVTRNGKTRIVAFANGRSRLVIPKLLSTDAKWVVATLDNETIWAGGMTNVWLNDKLQCMASMPVEIALSAEKCVVVSKRPSWLSVRKTGAMDTVHCNDQPINAQINPVINLIRFPVNSGESRITWEKKPTEVT